MSAKPGQSGVYAGQFGRPSEGVRLVVSENAGLYGPGGDGRNYLLWPREGALVAQEFEASSFKLVGEPHTVADPIGKFGIYGRTAAATSANGSLLYSASSASVQLTWYDRSGKLLGTMGEPGEYGAFSLSPSANRVAASRPTATGQDIWLLNRDPNVPASRFTFAPGQSLMPIWSPDSRTIVYRTGSPQNLFRRETSGAGGEERLISSPNTQYPTDWSQDGKLILYTEVASDTKRDIWVIPVTPDGKLVDGAKPRPYVRTPANEFYARFSPGRSPRWVAYISDESGRDEVYVQTFPEAHGKWQISSGGGDDPLWGASDQELFYRTPDRGVVAVSLRLTSESVEVQGRRELFRLPSTIEKVSRPFEVTADGQRFLVRAAPEQASRSLTMIVSWPAFLKKASTP
jgi:Tol biopolymer transport system component